MKRIKRWKKKEKRKMFSKVEREMMKKELETLEIIAQVAKGDK